MKNTKDKISILYLYDIKNWAINNVGELWLENNHEIEATYLSYKDFHVSLYNNYTYVWFGYSDMFLNLYLHNYISSVNLKKSIVSIHDPLEIFPDYKKWKNENINMVKKMQRKLKLEILKQAQIVTCISDEMKNLLDKNGLLTDKIPTTSTLQIRKRKLYTNNNIKIISIYNKNPRKNISLLQDIVEYCKETFNIDYYLKTGVTILSEEKYKNLLDSFSIYLCTSYQEGGPLPAMDAMKRGCVVISTPVGQMRELIQNGENGYLCNSKEEFIQKIKKLYDDKELLLRMRKKSITTIAKMRNESVIKQTVYDILQNVTNTKSKNEIFNFFTIINIYLKVFIVKYVSLLFKK